MNPDELLRLAESWRSRALRSADRREVAAYRFCASQLERVLRTARESLDDVREPGRSDPGQYEDHQDDGA